jgi:hypothetical protein
LVRSHKSLKLALLLRPTLQLIISPSARPSAWHTQSKYTVGKEIHRVTGGEKLMGLRFFCPRVHQSKLPLPAAKVTSREGRRAVLVQQESTGVVGGPPRSSQLSMNDWCPLRHSFTHRARSIASFSSFRDCTTTSYIGRGAWAGPNCLYLASSGSTIVPSLSHAFRSGRDGANRRPPVDLAVDARRYVWRFLLNQCSRKRKVKRRYSTSVFLWG